MTLRKLPGSTGSLTLAAAAAIPCATPSIAQSVEAADGTDSGIADIVVTAQRRAESIQNSSLSISVLDPKALQTVSGAKDLATLVPGVQISNGGSTMQTYVRGIGDLAAARSTSPRPPAISMASMPPTPRQCSRAISAAVRC